MKTDVFTNYWVYWLIILPPPTLYVLYWLTLWRLSRWAYNGGREMAKMGGAICLLPFFWLMFADGPVPKHR
ncbi:MAG: hypothetical protein WC480_00555 [Patescibacteria group bacterium]